MTISERDTLLKDPDVQQLPCAPHIGDPFYHTGKKPNGAFRDKLKEINKKHKSAIVPTTITNW